MRPQRNECLTEMPFLGIKDDPLRILTLNDAAALIASHPGVPTLHRWISHGVRGVQLKSVLIGGRRMIRLEDLEEFMEALNSPEIPTVSPAAENDEKDMAYTHP